MKKDLGSRSVYFLRDMRYAAMFRALRKHCRGLVLDVGGWDFFLTARRKKIPFSHWTTLEHDADHVLDLGDDRCTVVHGDGCSMTFEDESFDTVLNIQVLEHVFEPIRMVEECARVLKRGGTGIFVVPQTGVVHGAPHDYYNFTIFWIREVMTRTGLEIVEITPMGGIWNTAASHLFLFVLYSYRRRLKSPTGARRNWVFYCLYPLMVLYAVVNIPICLFLSLGDLSEEANNHLVVVRKPLH
jgi:SAM-dependent methyltransferase